MSGNPLDLRQLCALHDDVHTFTRSDQVEHLSSLIDSQATDAASFFEKNHLTAGMQEFLRGALKRLAGDSSQAVFELKQAMGGGKTHNMIALGMVAKNPGMARYLPDELTEGFEVRQARIAAVNGRAVDRDAYLWGDIAKQLGKGHEFQHKWKNGPVDMDEKDWMELIGGEPTLIMLDELPPTSPRP
jgi:predicted AAA+ superfamily ATPase